MHDDEVPSALRVGAALGPFFRLHPAPGADWVSWAGLLADPAVFTARAAEVQTALSAGVVPEKRVVASLVHLGLVGRLLAPAIGAAVAGGVLPVVSAGGVHLRLAGSNPLPLALTGVSAVDVGSPAAVAEELSQHWLTPLVRPWTALVAAMTGLSEKVLVGNVVSAVAGALTIAVTARPDLTHRSTAVLDALLATGPLAGTGERRCDGSFARRSCCLFYRLPGAGTCADCVLTRS
ncbi:(2Fe-2S)-binding protein [Modestobacter sp. DSM 44400]|uniref:(2Fe-2S)-binding protein n=1 Tax=Modestobacter sp. DSM 44400 TaxID=1550230 RepID=UPI0011151374|nr:(2Fe-2S)-binding protein [Modestobacter sp. DSM 44400]